MTPEAPSTGPSKSILSLHFPIGYPCDHMEVSENSGFSPQIIHLFIGFSIINHPFWGTPIFGNLHVPGKSL